MKKWFFVLLAGLLLLSCTGSLNVDNNSVTVTLSDKSKVMIQPVNGQIFRISAVPEGERFSARPSLMRVAGETPPVPFECVEEEQRVIVKTESLQASVDKITGEMIFMDLEGHVILQENKGGGKSFEPVEVDGDKGYTIRQVFESPENEAFYGLGQHQSDEFNYKGKNETLYQYNTKVSVPFILSNKHYGLLWDNNSLSRFGNPEDYRQLDVLDLMDADGQEGALTAVYASSDGKTEYLRRREPVIDYTDLDKVKNFPEGIPFHNARITWEGTVGAKESGIHHFLLYYAGYTRVFFNGEEVVGERWRTAWNPNSYKFQIDMEAGVAYPLRIDWVPDGGISYLGLSLYTPVDPLEQEKQSWWSEMADMIDYYFIYGQDSDQIISGYRLLTGKAQIMPKWAMGYWQSRERYKTSDELLGALNEYRKRGIPIDNMVLDWFYWPVDSWGSHEFDKERFPDPKAMVDSVHAQNARIMISVWPKFYHTTEHYKEYEDNGWMYTRAVEDSIRDWIAPGYIGSFYDAYAPGARKLFWQQMEEHLYPLGFDAWWMDASEPDIQSNASLEYRKELSTPTALGPSARYLNAYSLVNAQAIYEGQRSTDPGRRVFLLTRSGFPGLQRYSTATWSGDIGTRWEDLKAQISAGINFSISGIPYWTMDIGGFCVERRYERALEGSPDMEEWRELNARWFQFGAFCPLFRSHGQYPYREIFNIAPENHPVYKTMVQYNKLRYRLMPYIYTLAGKTWFEDYTIMRGLIMDFAQDENVINISDQYMFGSALMVCPVYEFKARKRDVYLPRLNDWYDFHTGKYLPGGQQFTADAPLDTMPIYVKAGTILPVGPEIRHTGEKPGGPITLCLYTGADARFTLYEDEGVNYNYEKGSYTNIPFQYDQQTGIFTIGAREGSFEGMTTSREFQIRKITPQEPGTPFAGGASLTTVTYNGEALTIQL
ncbi:MAG: Alpha-xylosidase [Bacteroidetes bacterium ADurb.Bin139]|nr:MAG: Alpha-xylosidase [Bacteroidetes bacterium ADurb.Bin139]